MICTMNKQKPTAPVGAGLIILSSVFYASYGVWTKLMGSAFGGYLASGIRSIGVLLILLVIAAVLKKLEPLQLRRTWPYIGGMLLAALFIWGPYYYAILHAGVGVSMTINYASFVIGMLVFGVLMDGERFTKTKLISAVLGIVGLVLMCLTSITGAGWMAFGAAAVSGILAAFSTLLVKLIPYNATQSTIASWATSIVSNLFMAVVLRETVPAFGWDKQWVALLVFVVASLIASLTYNTGLKLIDAGIAGVLGLLQIALGVVFGVVLFHERPSLLVLVGVIVIIIASAVPYLQKWRAAQVLSGRVRQLATKRA